MPFVCYCKYYLKITTQCMRLRVNDFHLNCYTNTQDIEYVRSHYNIEDFIYFNHHRRDEHAQLHHFVLNPIFKLHSKMFLKVNIGGKKLF